MELDPFGLTKTFDEARNGKRVNLNNIIQEYSDALFVDLENEFEQSDAEKLVGELRGTFSVDKDTGEITGQGTLRTKSYPKQSTHPQPFKQRTEEEPLAKNGSEVSGDGGRQTPCDWVYKALCKVEIGENLRKFLNWVSMS